MEPVYFFSGRRAQRVAVFCYLLALEAGLSREDADLLRLVAPARNASRGCAPDGAGGSSACASWTDCVRGLDIMKNSGDDIMKAAGIVARQYHEHWNGCGYPMGLRAEEIHIFARIAGLANVFDALTHWRLYPEPFGPADVAALIRRQRGRRFDPRLVDIFLHNLDEFFKIRNRYPEAGNLHTRSDAGRL